MGTEAVWIPALIAAAGVGVQQYNTAQTAKKRDEEIARGIRESGIQQDRTNRAIDENLDELETSRAEPYKKELTDTFMDRIKKKRLLGLEGLNTRGDTSEAYKKGADKAKVGSVGYAGLIADLLAGIDAAGNQRQAEFTNASDVGMDINKFKRNANQDAYLAQLRASRYRDNPWLAILGGGLQGYGAAGGNFGYGGTAKTVPITGGSGVTPGSFNTGIGLDKYAAPYRGLPGRI